MRIVAAVVLVVAGMGRAVAADPERYECPAFQFAADAGPSVVVASTFIGVSLRYELGRADRVCTRRFQGREERLRSFPIRGTARPRTPARNRTLLALEDRFIDLDTRTANSVLLPETEGLAAYACYRLLSDSPAARLCLPSDLDGAGAPAGKGLFCNRGRCRPRKVLFVSAVPDLYEGAWDAQVTLPGATTPVDAVATTVRTDVGRLDTTIALGTRDAFSLGTKLAADRRARFAGERQTGVDPPVAVDGDGRLTGFSDLTVTADLTSVQGTTTFSMRRTDVDPAPTQFAGCWLLAVRDDAGSQTTIRLPLVVSSNGLGASRPTDELVGGDAVVTTLEAGTCSVAKSGRLACLIPAGGSDVRLFGILTKAPDGGRGDIAFGAAGRAGTWTATPCPTS